MHYIGRQRLGAELDEWHWLRNYTECFGWTRSSKLTSLDFHIRRKALMCNSKLCKMTKTNADCTWGAEHDQNTIHMMWHGKIVREIWSEIINWFSK